MALKYTPPADLGNQLPDFQLPGVDGNTYTQESLSAPVKLVMFICNHCPYVIAIEDRLVELAASYTEEQVQFIAICSNDAKDYPEDSFENLKKRSEEKNYSFIYLHDESQEVAKGFGAVCTPDFFLYDSDNSLQYRGRLDDNWKNPAKVEQQELKTAIDCLLSSKSIPEPQHPSMGCSIKWIEA